MSRSLWLIALLPVVTACGGGSDIEVNLQGPSVMELDPFVAVGAEFIRVTAQGVQPGEFAAADLELSARSVTLEGFVGELTDIRAEVFDGQGNVLGLGRRQLTESDEGPFALPVRRNLAYVILDEVQVADPENPDDPNQDRIFQAGELHVIDMFSGARLLQVPLPGTDPRSRAMTNWGGRSIIVLYDDTNGSHVGRLDTATHEWTTAMLPGARDLIVATAESSRALLFGGGRITPIDLETMTLESDLTDEAGAPLALSGRITDGVMAGNGRTALVVSTAGTGLARIDLDFRSVEPLDSIADPSGVGLASDGRNAFVASSTDRFVAKVDLETGFDDSQQPQFLRPVHFAAFAEALDAFVGVERLSDNGRGRVLLSDTRTGSSLNEDTEIGTLLFPTAVATDGLGRRGIVVAKGGPGSDPGMTLFEVLPDAERGRRADGFFFPTPIGTTLSYPPQTVEFPERGPVLVRFPPLDVAVVFAR